ncbi:MAG TPA: hypothetical protein VKK31_26745 [Thermoanaerobaculia bacterium]|nr:hypothetical protein [Thermoanaerobaculia bacterium]
MGNFLTLRPTEEQQIRWADAARRCGKPVLAFVAWATDWTAGYLREQENRSELDPVVHRLQEKRCMGELLKASKRALQYMPEPFRSPMYGTPQDPAGDLRRAIDEVQEFLAATGEEYRV